VALALGALLGPASASAQQAEAEVLAVIRTFFDGMRSKDTAALRSALHADARLMSTGRDQAGNLVVRSDAMDGFLRTVATVPRHFDEKIWDPEVRVDGDLATVWTWYAFYLDGTFSHCGVDAFQLARAADGWKIIQIADTRRTEGCPPTPPHAK
jgi:hypothetical protein